ncbi:hypothetical protein [Siphonobacter curvatus]|uniref:Uncharacterized protein n=1 Tax=Siphonobacter curvatus TaxID=2094562 RepID=A0A2S7IN93_9BACT|nr:hypothetical protein [Siphonobacter curvatus]PQA59165.1 hypothetical protein C5O19_05780 [Siphonobacter curvatus]
MLKTLTLEVPKHLKKFFENGEYGPADQKGRLQIEKWSEIGRLLHLVSRTIPFTQKVRETSGSTITLAYHLREKAYEIPYDKIPDLVRQLDEIFRRTLICEVRRVHELAGGDYSPFIRDFLTRYDIDTAEDCDWEVIRKIYRDYLQRIEKVNDRRRKMLEMRPPMKKSSAQKVRQIA